MSISDNYWKKYLWEKSYKIAQTIELFKTKISNFNPYQNNGGTIVSIAEQDFCVIASDTRYSNGFSILSRFQTRILKLSNFLLISTSGMYADIRNMQKYLKENSINYRNDNKEEIPIDSCAFYLSSILYSKRFFPYYTFNILSGLEKNNKSCMYSFDSVGSFEKAKFGCVGSGQNLIQTLLDANYKEKIKKKFCNLKLINNTVALIKEFFIKAGKRGIYIGDGLQIFIITKKGILVENNILKTD